MNWKPIKRNDAGYMDEGIAEELEEYESTSVVFWDSVDGIPEVFESDHVLLTSANPRYTHYMKIDPPKVDRRKKEYKKGSGEWA